MSDMGKAKNSQNPDPQVGEKSSRRSVLAAGAAVAASIALPGNAAARTRYGKQVANQPVFGRPRRRRYLSFDVRFDAARSYLQKLLPVQKTNNDEVRYRDFRGNFAKGLEHDPYGNVDPYAYRSLIRAIATNRDTDYERIRVDRSVGERKLKNPQGGYKFEMSGLDGHSTRTDAAPAFASAETAAEMGELYAMALARDISFTAYEYDRTLEQLASELNSFSHIIGPTDDGRITPKTIFRGETPGDLIGPYVSQFLLRDVPYGPSKIVQKYAAPQSGVDFVTEYDEWLAVQRGARPQPLKKYGAKYIYNARTLGEYVHTDVLFQAYFNAALIISSFGPDALAHENPYRGSDVNEGFISFGGPDVFGLVTKAANLALTGAWYQKWLVHRRLRPEAYGGRVHHQNLGAKDYELPYDLVRSSLADMTKHKYGGYFLPMAYPEASPMHPAYPSGHASIAGACVTILKAFFDEDYELTNNVTASPDGEHLISYHGRLKLGDELNKLANNVALGRDWAGVHWRSDGADGLLIGEQQAIGLLKDYSKTYTERFNGFTITRFDGTKHHIRNGRVSAAY